MGIIPISKSFSGTAACGLLAGIGAGAILLAATLAFAQDGGDSAPAAAEKPGFFGAIGRWFDDQTSTLGSHLKGARTGVENLGNEAGVAAKTTVEGAKDAAGAVTRIPTSRVFTGHEKCASRAEWRARLRGRRQRHLQDQRVRIRQERRHDHHRGLPAAGLSFRPQQRSGMPQRDLRLPRALPVNLR